MKRSNVLLACTMTAILALFAFLLGAGYLTAAESRLPQLPAVDGGITAPATAAKTYPDLILQSFTFSPNGNATYSMGLALWPYNYATMEQAPLLLADGTRTQAKTVLITDAYAEAKHWPAMGQAMGMITVLAGQRYVMDAYQQQLTAAQQARAPLAAAVATAQAAKDKATADKAAATAAQAALPENTTEQQQAAAKTAITVADAAITQADELLVAANAALAPADAAVAAKAKQLSDHCAVMGYVQ